MEFENNYIIQTLRRLCGSMVTPADNKNVTNKTDIYGVIIPTLTYHPSAMSQKSQRPHARSGFSRVFSMFCSCCLADSSSEIHTEKITTYESIPSN